MIAHIVFNDYAYDQRVRKEVEALRKNDFDIKVIATVNADFNIGQVSYYKFLFKVFLLLLKIKPNVIHAHDWYGLLPAFLFSILHKNILIYDAHELYFDRKRNFRKNIILLIEKISISKTDRIINTNPYRAKIFNLIHRTKNITIISNKYYSNNLRKSLNKNSSSVNVVYMGVISLDRGIEAWINSISEINNIKFHIIGNGPDYSYLKSKYLSEKIKFYGMMTHQEMQDTMNSMHIGVISYNKEGLNNYYCEPNKVGEYAYFALPFISNYNYTLSSIVKRYKIGFTVNTIDKNTVKSIIDKIVINYDKIQENLVLYREENNWELESKTLIKMYESFIS